MKMDIGSVNEREEEEEVEVGPRHRMGTKRHAPCTKSETSERERWPWTDEKKQVLRMAVSSMSEDKISWAKVAEQVSGDGMDSNKCRFAYYLNLCIITQLPLCLNNSAIFRPTSWQLS